MSSSSRSPLREIDGPGVTWSIVKKLGAGSFGDVYLAVDKRKGSGSEVAIKVEDVKNPHPQLAYEAKLMSTLKAHKPDAVGFVNLFYQGSQKGYNVLVMAALGQNLEDLLLQAGGTFSLKTVLLLTDQILQRLETVHSAGFVHRDIKPENFMMGRGREENTVFLIDFGLSKRFMSSSTREHIPYKDNKSLTGTARYASINAHRGIEQSRRDDLEAVGHMLFYFLNGQLPWQGLPAKTKEEKYRKIKEKKISSPIADLCKGFPVEFDIYLSNARNLGFQDKPDYAFLRKLFSDRFKAEEFDRGSQLFDWQEARCRVPATANSTVAPDSPGNRATMGSPVKPPPPKKKRGCFGLHSKKRQAN